MSKLILTMVALVAFMASAVEESYLYWMVDTADGTAGTFAYDAVQVRAYETAVGVDSGSCLTLYYGNGVEAGTSVSAASATSGLGLYASLVAAAGPSYSYVVEPFNDGAKVARSDSIVFTDATAQNIMRVTTSGTFPAMAPWMAGGFSAVPEPNSALLLLLGCAALGLRRKKAEELT